MNKKIFFYILISYENILYIKIINWIILANKNTKININFIKVLWLNSTQTNILITSLGCISMISHSCPMASISGFVWGVIEK
jgi:hypothetical protein